MSRYSGRYYKGAARDVRIGKRAQAEARDTKRFEDITQNDERPAQSTD